MDGFLEVMSAIAAYGGIAFLCMSGIVISCFGLSGTWLVAGAALAGMVYRDGGFPSFWVLLAFLVLSGLIELVEFLASGWGVRRRGGSRLAGFAAVVGGLLGLGLGTLIPIPVFGSLLGMLAGGFGLAYLVEYNRLNSHNQAGNIAFGVVIARIAVVLLKVIASLGMTLILFAGFLIN